MCGSSLMGERLDVGSKPLVYLNASGVCVVGCTAGASARNINNEN